MFAMAAKQGVVADSTITDELEASDGEEDSRSRPELQPRLSGDENVAAETNEDESSDDSAVGLQFTRSAERVLTSPLQDDTSDDETSSSADSSDDDEDEDEDVAIDVAANEEQDEFDRELARMMAESGREARQPVAMRRNVLNERSLPILKRQPISAQPEEEDPQHMRFTLLMKKGAKQQVRAGDLCI